ncbi:MAG: RHS repeat-associated core domain-containing protein [Phaeodactylibacter sp.]|nr:RHS repeat-associated core domain-containing protein [Phaeodactylibacter sp.]
MERSGSPERSFGKNKYLYNGKELSADYEINLYEYGTRWYDPAVGRFTGVDPIAEEFPWVSTYNYAENEPVANIDLHGLQKVRAVNEFKSRVAGATEAVGRKLEQGMGYVNAKYSQAKNAFWSVLGYEPPAGTENFMGVGRFAGRGPEDREGTSTAIIDGLPLPVGGGSGLKVWRNSQLESFEKVANGLDKAVDAYNAYKDENGNSSTVNDASAPYEIGATPDQTPTRPTKFGTDTVSVPAIIHYSNDSTSRGSVLFERSKSPNPRGGVVTGNSTKESIKPLFNLIKDKK